MAAVVACAAISNFVPYLGGTAIHADHGRRNMRKRFVFREVLFLLCLPPLMLFSAWVAFRVSIMLGRPVLLEPQDPGYLVSIAALLAVLFGVVTVILALILGLRFGYLNGKPVLMDPSRVRSEGINEPNGNNGTDHR
jgi:hypothetical protein